ncbi:MAG: hypothetical protein GF364_01360 [Candidatus Lokiarchaeota archaeon]|nr:hypothetical protein [Candidatus Lokiarchaeota archaeon]
MKNAKVAFIGLDNAGKTSSLIALKKKYNFQDEIDDLKPTIRIERTSFRFLNMDIFHHDFGGQEQYRTDYLKHKDRFLSNTDLIFYVVDIQDQERFDESVTYFNEIAEYFKKNEIKLPIIVMLHKFDPKIREDKEIIHGIMDVKKRITEWLPHHNIYYFETSIYDLYSLIDAFSFGMAQIFERRDLIEKFIETTAGEFETTIAMLLFDENGVAISEFYKPHLSNPERNKIYEIFLNVEKRIKDSTSNVYEFSDWINYDTRISGVIQSFKVGYLNFYVLLVIEEVSEDEAVELLDKFQSYRLDLSDILKGLLSDSSVSI